tara:strand:- start:668 stop:1027 length:360 start_codon:yes stop_codon:yes gene_type:complete
MSRKTHTRLSDKVKYLEMESNRISDELNIEFEILETTKKYHKIKRSDLPMFRKHNAYDSTWIYKLDVMNGKLECLKMVVSDCGQVELHKLLPEMILDNDTLSNQEEWHNGVCKLLKYID